MGHDDQNLWYVLFSLFFVFLVAAAMWVLLLVHGALPVSISLFDLALVSLATFRLIRLFSRDIVTKFIRDWFTDKREVVLEAGGVTIERVTPARGPRKTAADILECPWCVGVWWALVVTFFYFLTPLAWYPILFLAVAGVATFIQLTASWIGWSADQKKHEVHSLQ